MQILKIPTFWNAEQADIVYQFFGEFGTVIWRQYHQDIEWMYEEIRDKQNKVKKNDNVDDEIDF